MPKYWIICKISLFENNIFLGVIAISLHRVLLYSRSFLLHCIYAVYIAPAHISTPGITVLLLWHLLCFLAERNSCGEFSHWENGSKENPAIPASYRRWLDIPVYFLYNCWWESLTLWERCYSSSRCSVQVSLHIQHWVCRWAKGILCILRALRVWDRGFYWSHSCPCTWTYGKHKSIGLHPEPLIISNFNWKNWTSVFLPMYGKSLHFKVNLSLFATNFFIQVVPSQCIWESIRYSILGSSWRIPYVSNYGLI